MVTRESDWLKSAGCAEKDPNLFSVNERMSYEENKANLEAGIEICMDCPVFVECWEDATPSDQYHTVRAGRMPEVFSTTMESKEGMKTCRRGHVHPPGRCKECKKIADDARHLRQREARQAAKPPRRKKFPSDTPPNHAEWPAPAEGEPHRKRVSGKGYSWRESSARWVRTS